MFSMLRSFKSAPKVTRQTVIKQFMEHPEHQWFAKDPVLSRLFKVFCDSWSDQLVAFIAKEEVLILKAEGHLACALAPVRDANVILAFPDLVKVLRSASPIRALAILAHELGHLVLKHSSRKISNIEAQVEADEFAFHMGYGRELEQVLLEYEHSVDCRVRVARLTQLYYANLSN